VLIILLGVLMAAAGALGWLSVRFHATDTAEIQAKAAGRADIPRLLSYDYRTIDDQLAQNRALTTGAFADNYKRMMSGALVGDIKRNHASVQTTVLDAAVVASAPDRVTLLMVLDQGSQNDLHPDQHEQTVRLQIGLARETGRWLVSNIKSV
jgi:Mce-associated membrane protein